MNEENFKEKVNQILENQLAMMNVLFSQNYGNSKGKLTFDKLNKELWNTIRLLNPPKQPSIAERTEEALGEKKKTPEIVEENELYTEYRVPTNKEEEYDLSGCEYSRDGIEYKYFTKYREKMQDTLSNEDSE